MARLRKRTPFLDENLRNAVIYGQYAQAKNASARL